MAELSARSGVQVPTIRYYQREGLLAPGRLTSPNQADYDETHVRRLRLVRALLDVGGLSVAEARAVVATVDAKAENAYIQLGRVQYALTPQRETNDIDEERVREVDDLLSRQGWHVRADNPARASLAAALATLEHLGIEGPQLFLDRYAEAVREFAKSEVDAVLRRVEVDEVAEAIVAFDIVGDSIISALRRLAQEDAITERIRPAGHVVPDV